MEQRVVDVDAAGEEGSSTGCTCTIDWTQLSTLLWGETNTADSAAATDNTSPSTIKSRSCSDGDGGDIPGGNLKLMRQAFPRFVDTTVESEFKRYLLRTRPLAILILCVAIVHQMVEPNALWSAGSPWLFPIVVAVVFNAALLLLTGITVWKLRKDTPLFGDPVDGMTWRQRRKWYTLYEMLLFAIKLDLLFMGFTQSFNFVVVCNEAQGSLDSLQGRAVLWSDQQDFEALCRPLQIPYRITVLQAMIALVVPPRMFFLIPLQLFAILLFVVNAGVGQLLTHRAPPPPPMILLGLLVSIVISMLFIFFSIRQENTYRSTFKQLLIAAQETLRSYREHEGFKYLLSQMLPPVILERYVTKTLHTDAVENATVFFSDVVMFTHWSSNRKPNEVVAMLSSLASGFDSRTDEYGVEKIKTIGDGYWAVCGIPSPCKDHALRMVRYAMSCQHFVFQLNKAHPEWGGNLRVRVGIHSGSLIGGVLGTHQVSYEVFGNTNHVAEAAEQRASPGHLLVTETTLRQLEGCFAFFPAAQVPCHQQSTQHHDRGEGDSGDDAHSSSVQGYDVCLFLGDVDQYAAALSHIDDGKAEISLSSPNQQQQHRQQQHKFDIRDFFPAPPPDVFAHQRLCPSMTDIGAREEERPEDEEEEKKKNGDERNNKSTSHHRQEEKKKCFYLSLPDATRSPLVNSLFDSLPADHHQLQPQPQSQGGEVVDVRGDNLSGSSQKSPVQQSSGLFSSGGLSGSASPAEKPMPLSAFIRAPSISDEASVSEKLSQSASFEWRSPLHRRRSSGTPIAWIGNPIARMPRPRNGSVSRTAIGDLFTFQAGPRGPARRTSLAETGYIARFQAGALLDQWLNRAEETEEAEVETAAAPTEEGTATTQSSTGSSMGKKSAPSYGPGGTGPLATQLPGSSPANNKEPSRQQQQHTETDDEGVHLIELEEDKMKFVKSLALKLEDDGDDNSGEGEVPKEVVEESLRRNTGTPRHQRELHKVVSSTGSSSEATTTNAQPAQQRSSASADLSAQESMRLEAIVNQVSEAQTTASRALSFLTLMSRSDPNDERKIQRLLRAGLRERGAQLHTSICGTVFYLVLFVAGILQQLDYAVIALGGTFLLSLPVIWKAYRSKAGAFDRIRVLRFIVLEVPAIHIGCAYLTQSVVGGNIAYLHVILSWWFLHLSAVFSLWQALLLNFVFNAVPNVLLTLFVNQVGVVSSMPYTISYFCFVFLAVCIAMFLRELNIRLSVAAAESVQLSRRQAKKKAHLHNEVFSSIAPKHVLGELRHWILEDSMDPAKTLHHAINQAVILFVRADGLISSAFVRNHQSANPYWLHSTLSLFFADLERRVKRTSFLTKIKTVGDVMVIAGPLHEREEETDHGGMMTASSSSRRGNKKNFPPPEKGKEEKGKGREAGGSNDDGVNDVDDDDEDLSSSDSDYLDEQGSWKTSPTDIGAGTLAYGSSGSRGVADAVPFGRSQSPSSEVPWLPEWSSSGASSGQNQPRHLSHQRSQHFRSANSSPLNSTTGGQASWGEQRHRRRSSVAVAPFVRTLVGPACVEAAHLALTLQQAVQSFSQRHGANIEMLTDAAEDAAGKAHAANELEGLDNTPSNSNKTARPTVEGVSLRAGVHVGPVIGTVMGQVRLAYDIFGPAVNMSSRLMNSSPVPGVISCSKEFHDICHEHMMFVGRVRQSVQMGFSSPHGSSSGPPSLSRDDEMLVRHLIALGFAGGENALADSHHSGPSHSHSHGTGNSVGSPLGFGNASASSYFAAPLFGGGPRRTRQPPAFVFSEPEERSLKGIGPATVYRIESLSSEMRSTKDGKQAALPQRHGSIASQPPDFRPELVLASTSQSISGSPSACDSSSRSPQEAALFPPPPLPPMATATMENAQHNLPPQQLPGRPPLARAAVSDAANTRPPSPIVVVSPTPLSVEDTTNPGGEASGSGTNGDSSGGSYVPDMMFYLPFTPMASSGTAGRPGHGIDCHKAGTS